MYSKCATSCGITCENHDLPLHRKPQCSGFCKEGCACRPGFIPLSSDPANTKCVLPKDCPRRCPVTQTYRQCGHFCGVTCQNYHFPPRLRPVCSSQCFPGCFCKDGLIPLGKGSTCVRPDDCPTALCSLKPKTGHCRYIRIMCISMHTLYEDNFCGMCVV